MNYEKVTKNIRQELKNYIIENIQTMKTLKKIKTPILKKSIIKTIQMKKDNLKL